MPRRIVLVTGASTGIGAAIACRFAADGALVLGVARDRDALDALEMSIRNEGAAFEPWPCDLLDRNARAALVAQVLQRHSRVDVLVNNAGANVRQAAVDAELATWDRLLELMLTAPFELSRELAPRMRATGFGRIVNVGSVAGMRALPTGAAYAAAKGGLEQLTRVLAREWGAEGVTVNLVAPWYVPTPLTEGVLAEPAFRDAVLACTPSGRLGTPEEVAAAIAFLASDDAGWINGVALPLDGGFTSAGFFPPARSQPGE